MEKIGAAVVTAKSKERHIYFSCRRVSMDQENGPIDTQKSTLTIHVGKTGAFSALGHEHEVRAPIHSGVADTGSHPTVEVRVDARAGFWRAPGRAKSKADISRGTILVR
jgi:hypothetical protein